jgi:hypothetical protein
MTSSFGRSPSSVQQGAVLDAAPAAGEKAAQDWMVTNEVSKTETFMVEM